MVKSLITSVPAAYAEALGWATIEWTHLEAAIDVILAIAEERCAEELLSLVPSQKIAALKKLAEITRSNGWYADLAQAAHQAEQLHAKFSDARRGTVFGRGADNASYELRRLAAKSAIGLVLPKMTTSNIKELVLELDACTRKIIALAVRVAERPSLLGQ